MSVPVKRDALGRVLPGHSLNPEGRPVTAINAVREKLKVHIDVYVTELTKLMGDADPEIRLAALREYGDRLMGKPVMSVDSDVRTTKVDMSAAWSEWLAKQTPGSGANTIEGDAGRSGPRRGRLNCVCARTWRG